MKSILPLIITIISCASSDCPPVKSIPHQDFPQSGIAHFKYSSCNEFISENGVKRLNIEYEFNPMTGNVIKQTEFSEDTALGKNVEILLKYDKDSPHELQQSLVLVFYRKTSSKRDPNYDIIEESEEIVCDTAVLESFINGEHKVYKCKNGLLESFTITYHNSCNQETGAIEYSANAKIKGIASIEIDSKGRILHLIKMDSDSNVLSRIKYGYDKNSNLITQKTYNSPKDSSVITLSNYSGTFYNKISSSKQAKVPEFEILIFRNDFNLVTKKIFQVKRENIGITSDTFYYEYSK